MACAEGSAALPSPTALRCKLPAMSAIDMASGDNPAGGGFVQIPGGLFTPDPRAASAGLGRPIYDAAIHDWLPEPKGWRQYATNIRLAPDGTSYVYESAKLGPPNPNGPSGPISMAVHVVDIRTGSDRVVYESATPPLYDVLDYSPLRITLTPGCFECGAGGSNLWSLHERTGSLHKVSDLESYWSVQSGAAWGGVTTNTSAMAVSSG